MVLVTRRGRQFRPSSNARGFKGKRIGTRRGNLRWDGAVAPALRQMGSAVYKQPSGQYLKTLLDPEKNGSCIIPDLNSYPTSTYSLRQSLTVRSNAQGISGIILHLNGRLQYQIESSTSADGLFAFDAGVDVAGMPTIASTYVSHRLVGASVRAEFVGNDTNNQGLMIACSSANSNIDFTSFGNIAQIQAGRNVMTTAMKDGVMVIYKPADGTNYDMRTTNETFLSATGYAWGALQIHCTGLSTPTAGAVPCVVFHITAHFEGITNEANGDYEPDRATCVRPNEFNATIARANLVSSTCDCAGINQNLWSKAVDGLADIVKKEATGVAKKVITGGLKAYLPSYISRHLDY